MDPEKYTGAAAPPLEYERRRPQLAHELTSSSSDTSSEHHPALATPKKEKLTIDATHLQQHTETDFGSPTKVDVKHFLWAQERPPRRDSGLHDASYHTSEGCSPRDLSPPAVGSRRASGDVSLDAQPLTHQTPVQEGGATQREEDYHAPSSDIPSNDVFEGEMGGIRLYYQGVAKGLRKQELLQAKRIENYRRKERKEQCTFQPLISPHARAMQRPRALSPENRCLSEVLRKKAYLAQRRREVALEELKGCTFHPLTLAQANLDPSTAIRRYTVHQDLHDDHEVRQRYRVDVLSKEVQEMEDEVKHAQVRVNCDEVTGIVDRLLTKASDPQTGYGAHQPAMGSHDAAEKRYRPDLAPGTAKILSDRDARLGYEQPHDVVDRLLGRPPEEEQSRFRSTKCIVETGVATGRSRSRSTGAAHDQHGTDVRLLQVEHAFQAMVRAADQDPDMCDSVRAHQHRADGGVKDLHLARGATALYPASSHVQQVMGIIVRAGQKGPHGDGATFITQERFVKAAARAMREGTLLTFFRPFGGTRSASGEATSAGGAPSCPSARGASGGTVDPPHTSAMSKYSAELTRGRKRGYDRPTGNKFKTLQGDDLLPVQELPLDREEYPFAPKLTPYSGELPPPAGWEIHSQAAMERAQRLAEHRRLLEEREEADQ